MDDFLSYAKNKKALLRDIKKFSVKERDKIKQAITVAEKYHAGQKRNGEVMLDGSRLDYVIHCVRAALWLAQQGCCDVGIIIATILHDTLEDTNLRPEKIKEMFGKDVLNLVLHVTRSRENNETETDKRITKPRNYKRILNGDERVRLVKTADILDNMRSWQYISEGSVVYRKFSRWIDEARNYDIPIAESVSQMAANEMKIILKQTEERMKRIKV